MAIPVRIPEAREDRPQIAVLAGIAVVGIALGIGGAWWGTYERRVTESGEGTGTETATEAEAAPATETETEAEAGAETEAEAGAEAATEAATGAEAEAAPPTDEPEGAPAPQVAAEVVPVPAPAPAPAVAPTPPAPAAGPVPDDSLRVVRGRVAYLRCEGVPQRAGPVPCPRDEALEAAAWAAIEPLVACPALPRQPGEADVVLDLATGAIAEIRARDTFARDVVRLDGERVVACLTAPLTRVQQTMGASRLVVSFRFAIR